MQLLPPSSQKAGDRPISFVLDDGDATTAIDLVIRPEELTRTDPSRVNMQQTLGDTAWADNFGPGLAQISLSGHTGWRTREGSALDGEARFRDLYDKIYTQWHEKRKFAAMLGRDPDTVKLIFSDALDVFSCVVAPMSFTLRRSKSRPLLCQYQIQLTVMNDSIDDTLMLGVGGSSVLSSAMKSSGYLNFGPVKSAAATEALGLDSLTASVNRITSYLADARNFVNGTLLAPVQNFMRQTTRLYGSVRNAISTGSQIAGSLINIAKSVTMAGVNIFRTLAAVVAIPSIVRSQLMQVASAYSNIYCVLRNALRKQRYIQDYSDLYGSSNCSSTSGGRPLSALAGVNPFFSVVPTREALPVSVTASAQKSILTLANADPVISPLPTDTFNNAVSEASAGLVVVA